MSTYNLIRSLPRALAIGWPAACLLVLVASACDSSTEPEDGNTAPTATFVADPENVRAGDADRTVVTLDSSDSIDPDGDSTSVRWTVPGGTFVDGTGPESRIAMVTFPGAAPYDVELVVTDARGGEARTSRTVGLIANGNPAATFTADPASIPRGDGNRTIITLDASDSSDPDGDPLTYRWTVPSGTFVDGTNGSSKVPHVTFPGAAPYTVVLVVQDDHGGEATFSFTVGISGEE